MATDTNSAGPNSLAVLSAAISLVSTVVPEVGALMMGLKMIWQKKNPDKTEADYLADLLNVSDQLVSDADTQLIADGFTRVGGKWVPPPASGGQG